jgi:hypothetical protein
MITKYRYRKVPVPLNSTGISVFTLLMYRYRISAVETILVSAAANWSNVLCFCFIYNSRPKAALQIRNDFIPDQKPQHCFNENLWQVYLGILNISVAVRQHIAKVL